MIDYGLFEFATAPSTGASWFVKTAQLAGLGPGFAHHAREPWVLDHSGKFRVSMVRHPAVWIDIFYQRYIQQKHPTVSIIHPFQALRSDSLESFALDYVDKMPGGITSIMRRYKSDAAVRIEDLPWSMIELLQPMGVEQVLLNTCKQFQPPQAKSRLPDSIKRLIRETDRNLYDEYDYW